jgi:hypothetical protein
MHSTARPQPPWQGKAGAYLRRISYITGHQRPYDVSQSNTILLAGVCCEIGLRERGCCVHPIVLFPVVLGCLQLAQTLESTRRGRIQGSVT